MAVAIDGNQFGVGQRGVALGVNQHAPVGRPAGNHGVAIPGAALGQAAFDGHGVDVDGALIFGAEGNGLAVRGNGSADFFPVLEVSRLAAPPFTLTFHRSPSAVKIIVSPWIAG